MIIDRSRLTRALAKAMAYAECDKPDAAEAWVFSLIVELRNQGIINPDLTLTERTP